MKSLLLFFSLPLTILITTEGWTKANMKDASYEEQWREGVIERSYSSRSLYEGMLGFGWCTNIEVWLDLTGPLPIVSICDIKSSATVFREGFRYRAALESGAILEFDRAGRLTLRTDPKTGVTIHLAYENSDAKTAEPRNNNHPSELPMVISDLQGNKWKLEFSSGHLIRISRGHLIWNYVVERDDLVRVRSSDQLPGLTYSYDELHNLTRIHSANRKTDLTYDSDDDQLRKIQDSNGCTEKLKYLTPASNQINQLNQILMLKNISVDSPTYTAPAYTASSLKWCPGSEPQYLKIDFWLQNKPDGTQILSKARLYKGRDITDVIFDPITGGALSVHHSLEGPPSRSL